MDSRSLLNKINIHCLKEWRKALSRIIENRRASDAKSVNVRRKDVDRRLVCVNDH